MTQNRVVADIRRHRGGSNFIIDLVRRFCSDNGVTTTEWLVRPDQAHLLPPAEIVGKGEPTDIEWMPQIRDRVIGYAQGGPAGGSLWVLSYDNQLLMMIERVSDSHPNVRVRHLADLIKSASIQRRVQRALPFPVPPGSDAASTTLPLSEAIELAKTILRGGGHTSPESALPQKDLRLKMEVMDKRAKKMFGDSRSVSLITDIVIDGRQNAWLQRFRRVPEKSGTELLYLTASQAQQAQPCPVSDPEPLPTAVTPPSVQKTKIHTRATDFENHLRKAQIGSMPETRELMFDAVERIFVEQGDRPPMLLLDVFAEAVQRAQNAADAAGYTAEKNWPVAMKCILRLMLWSGVLISDAEAVIADKIGCNSTRVAKLAPDFRLRCEGFIVLHIIRESETISYDDDPYYLGMTLYRRGLGKAVSSDELKIKADQILTYLDQQGKIEMDTDRQIRVRKRNSAAAAA